MFSKRLWKVLSFRLLIMDFGLSTPVTWNRKSKQLCSSNKYANWNFGMYQIYATFAALQLSLKLVITHVPTSIPMFDDVIDEVKQVANPLSSILIAIDISFAVLFIMVASTQLLFRKWKLEIIEFFNKLVEVDDAMEEIFKLQINLHPRYNQTVLLTESLMIFTCVVSLFIPIAFVVFFLQPVVPLHRMAVEILEIHPKLNLQTLPLIVFISWSVLQCSNTIILMFIFGFMYIKFYSFWISSLNPISISECLSFRPGKQYLTQLGYIKGVDMIRLYRIHQVLNKMCNQFFANRVIALHQAALKVVLVLSTFAVLHNLELIIYTPGNQIGFLGIGLCVIIEYLETKMVSEATDSSYILRRKIRNMTRRDDIVNKALGRTWDLRLHVAYPYFEMGRHTFLQFMQSSVSFVVDCLVAAK